MSDRTYLILRNRIERRLAKPRYLTIHMALFAFYSLIAGFTSLVTRPFSTMDGVIYWTIFAWSIIVSIHTLLAYMRSGAWATTRDNLIEEEILEASEEFHLSTEEMVDLHQRLSEDIRSRSGIFNKLGRVGIGYFLMWPGTFILLLFLQGLTSDYNLSSNNNALSGVFQIWQPFSLVGTLIFSLLLIPWRSMLPKAKSRSDLHDLYQNKGKRMTVERLSEIEFDDEGEILPEYEEKYKAEQRQRHLK